MAALRNLLRWSFALSALIFLQVGFRTFIHHYGRHTAVRDDWFLLLFIAIAFIFVMAFWTTRKPNGSRGWWGIAAGAVHLLICGVIFYFELRSSTYRMSFADPEILLVALSLACIFVFSRREQPEAPIPARASLPGDRTHPLLGKAITWLCYAAQYAGAWFWINYAYRHGIPFSIGIGYFALILLASLTTATLHECGHAVVAWIFEMKILGFNAGPFHWDWDRKAAAWVFKFRPSQIIAVGGAVKVVPTNGRQPRWHDVCMLAAGPLVNLCTGLAALYVALNAGNFNLRIWQYIALLASSSLVAAVQNMLPYLADGAYTDGARILQLLTNSPLADFFHVQLGTLATGVTPLRFRDMDIEPLQRVCNIYRTDFSAVHLRLLLSQHFEDAGNTPQALAVLLEAETICIEHSVDLTAPLHTCFVIGHALFHRDAVAARLWWDRMTAKEPANFNVDYWLARGCLLWTEGRLDEANDASLKADAEARKLGQGGGYEFDRDRCARLRRELDLAAQEPPAERILPPGSLYAGMPGRIEESMFGKAQALAAL